MQALVYTYTGVHTHMQAYTLTDGPLRILHSQMTKFHLHQQLSELHRTQ